MKKLRLELDDLEIESFDTSLVAETERTVVAHESDSYAPCTEPFSDPPACDATDFCGPHTWTADGTTDYCCHTWGLDSRCADSEMTYCNC